MQLRPVSAPLDDPLLGPVRRRHPDVDVVVLPPAPPATTPAPASAAPQVADSIDPTAALARVESATRPLLAALGLPADAHAETTFRFGIEEGVVRATASAVVHTDHGGALLDRLHALLVDGGWQVRRPAGGLPRLMARSDGLELSSSHSEVPGVLTLTLVSEPLSVGVVDARVLVARTGPPAGPAAGSADR